MSYHAGGGGLYTWDGVTHAPETVANDPELAFAYGLHHDPGEDRLLLLGSSALWELRGDTFTQLSAADVGAARLQTAFDAQRGELVAVSETSAGTETWIFDGSEWSLHLANVQPPATDFSSMTYDPAVEGGLLYPVGSSAGEQETWALGARGWRKLSPTSSPPAYDGGALAWHPAGHSLWLAPYDAAQRTWLFEAGEWSHPVLADEPPECWGAALALDASRDELVLYTTTEPAETWVWDGSAWTQRFPPSSPGQKYESSMACDPLRGVCVLFGGEVTDETWEWDGAAQTWTQVFPTSSPSPRNAHRLDWDPTLQRVVLTGGDTNTTIDNRVWAYDGATWVELEADAKPEGRLYHAAAVDEGSGELLIFGGQSSLGEAGDTWRLRSTGLRPEQVVLAPAQAVGLDEAGTELLSLHVTAEAGGRGGPSSAPESGAVLAVFDRLRWREVAANAASPSAPATVEATLVGDELRRLRTAQRFGLKVSPLAASVDEPAVVAVDYVELTLDYVIP